jgi:hypothetical protein
MGKEFLRNDTFEIRMRELIPTAADINAICAARNDCIRNQKKSIITQKM